MELPLVTGTPLASLTWINTEAGQSPLEDTRDLDSDQSRGREAGSEAGHWAGFRHIVSSLSQNNGSDPGTSEAGLVTGGH